MYTGRTLYFWGIPVEEIAKDVKDGKFILKTRGNIKADQVVVINGKATGNIHADTVVGLKDKQKEEKLCNSCRFLNNYYNIYQYAYCDRLKITVDKKGKICSFYQKKENPIK